METQARLESDLTARDLYSHPLNVEGSYTIWHRRLNLLHERLQKWLFSRQPGVAIWGTSRIGKTHAIELVGDSLITRRGEPIQSFVCSVRDKDKRRPRSEKEFWTMVLASLGSAFSESGTADERFRRTVAVLKEGSEKNIERRVVLIMDEAQQLHVNEYRQLADLYNELRRQKASITIVLVGSPELRGIVKSFVGDRHAHIKGRFCRVIYRYKGFNTAAEVAECLDWFDRRLEHPEGSSVTFTQHFLQQQFRDGFRLKSLAPRLWAAFKDVTCGTDLKEWPMAYLTATVSILLIDLLPGYALPNEVTDMELQLAVSETALLEGQEIED